MIDIEKISEIRKQIPQLLIQKLYDARENIHKQFEKTPCNCHRKETQRCCHSCSASFGYYHVGSSIFLEDMLIMCHYKNTTPGKIMEELNNLFDKENGFWTPNGCKLPRMMRSCTCSTYICDDSENPILRKKITELEWKEIYIVRKIIKIIGEE